MFNESKKNFKIKFFLHQIINKKSNSGCLKKDHFNERMYFPTTLKSEKIQIKEFKKEA